MSLELFARLTDAQIDEVLDHPRDDQGRLKRPAEPAREMTLLEALMQAEGLMVAAGVPQGEQQRAFDVIRARYAGSGKKGD